MSHDLYRYAPVSVLQLVSLDYSYGQYMVMAYIVMAYVVMGPYLSCSFCLWIVEPFGPQRDITLRFEQFELESGFDWVKVRL